MKVSLAVIAALVFSAGADAGDRRFTVVNSCSSGQCGFTVVNKTTAAPPATVEYVRPNLPPVSQSVAAPTTSACAGGNCPAPASQVQTQRRGFFPRR